MQLDNYPDANQRTAFLNSNKYNGVVREFVRAGMHWILNKMDRCLEEQKSKIEEVLENHGCECGCLAAVRSIK